MIVLTEEERKELEQHVDEGWIRKQICPYAPLFIYTYSTTTELEEHWDKYTRMSRGLVVCDKDNRIVIPCIPKFFNSGTKFAENITLADKDTIITEKNDGYLIQIVKDKQLGLVVTSKGSFTSPMVEKAKTLIKEEQLEEGITYVCELCCNFPGDEAIIVTRWNEEPKLVCFAKRDEDGNELPLDNLPECLEKVRQFNYLEALDYLKRTDIEGVVAYNDGKRVKFKTEHFLRLHRLISDIRKIRVWELLSIGEDIDQLSIPDEFMGTLKEWKKEMLDKITNWTAILLQYEAQYKSYTEKDIALNADIPQFYKVMMFNRRKNKPYRQIMWNRIRDEIKEENKQ